MAADTFSFGIEEEYFLVDAATGAVAAAPPEAFFAAATAECGGRVAREFLRAQIEVITPPHTDIAAARAELRELRQAVARIAAGHGLALLAAGTHPTAEWGEQRQTEGARYDAVMDDLRMIGRRDLLCGLHVHVELPAPEQRVDVMARLLPYLPLFIALGTSSPFWQSRRTGLRGYRLAAYDELPRTGIPELFRTQADYDAYIAALVRAAIIPDASYVWWTVRPSLNHPTLELRAPDSCTRLNDTIAIAALYRALVHHLATHPLANWSLDAIGRAIVVENKWRAQRYGIHGTFVMDGAGVTVAEALERVLADIGPSVAALGCTAEMEHCRAILRDGTSADRQLAIYDQARTSGASREQALDAVTAWLIAETLR